MRTDERPDDWARTLLHQAGSTIEVAPGAVVPSERRPRRPLVLAAAAAAAMVIATTILTGRGGSEPDPAPPPVPPPAASQVVPSVFGLTVEAATTRLEAAGLDVALDPGSRTCETPSRALGTDPETGEPVDGQVVLRVPKGTDVGGCRESLADREQAWSFLDLLAGRASSLTFADSVRLRVDALPELTLTRDQVTDLDAWQAPAALGTLGEALAAPGTTMATRAGAGESSAPRCGYPDPADLDSRTALTISLVTAGRTRVGGGCPVGIDLYRTDGAIDTIVVATALPARADVAMPELVGLSEDEARSRVATLGTDTQAFVAYRESGCDTSGLVSEQQPAAGRRLRPQDAVLAVVAVDTAGCGEPTGPTDAQRDVARALIGFADTDGTGAPAMTEQVELFVGNSPVGVFTRAELADPNRWRGCPEGATLYAEAQCPVSLLGGLQDDAVNDTSTRVVTRPDPLPCGGGLVAPGLPDRLTTATSIFLEPKELSCVYGYRLQLVLDDQDQITAANIIWESP